MSFSFFCMSCSLTAATEVVAEAVHQEVMEVAMTKAIMMYVGFSLLCVKNEKDCIKAKAWYLNIHICIDFFI